MTVRQLFQALLDGRWGALLDLQPTELLATLLIAAAIAYALLMGFLLLSALGDSK